MSTWGGQNAVQTSSRVPLGFSWSAACVPGILPQSHRPTICLCALGLGQSAWEDSYLRRDPPSWRWQCPVDCLHWLWKPQQPQLQEPLGCTGRRWDEACPEMEHSARQLQWEKANIWPWDSSFPAEISWANKKLLWVCSAAHVVSSSARFYHFPVRVANAQQCDEQEQLTDHAEN